MKLLNHISFGTNAHDDKEKPGALSGAAAGRPLESMALQIFPGGGARILKTVLLAVREMIVKVRWESVMNSPLPEGRASEKEKTMMAGLYVEWRVIGVTFMPAQGRRDSCCRGA